MSRILANVGLLLYVLLAAGAFFWSANFFSVNLDHFPRLDYRYIAATGIPFALMLMAVAGRQSVLPRFRLGLVIEVVLAGLFLWLAIYAFNFPPQANFFCAAHLAVCAVFTLLNYYGYRRELRQIEAREAAKQ